MVYLVRKVEEMERRLAEIEPVVKESEALKEAFISLKRVLENEEAGRTLPPPSYLRLPARQAQIEDILDVAPNLTNREIGERLGLTAARVSQIRTAMRNAERAA